MKMAVLWDVTGYSCWVVSNEASQALRLFSGLSCDSIRFLIPLIHPPVLTAEASNSDSRRWREMSLDFANVASRSC
jgi:hypothetical protein